LCVSSRRSLITLFNIVMYNHCVKVCLTSDSIKVIQCDHVVASWKHVSCLGRIDWHSSRQVGMWSVGIRISLQFCPVKCWSSNVQLGFLASTALRSRHVAQPTLTPGTLEWQTATVPLHACALCFSA
jgi:hypothetical protein